MGVAATAGLDATSTTSASFLQSFASAYTGFSLVGGTAPGFSSAGMLLAADTGINRTCAGAGRTADVSWRWTWESTSSGYAAFGLAATAAASQSSSNVPPSMLMVQTFGGNIELESVNASQQQTTVVSYTAFPTAAVGSVMDFRLTITEAGLLTIKIRNVSTGVTVVPVDGLDVSTLPFWANASGSLYTRLNDLGGGNKVRWANYREASHPAGEVARAARGSLLQLSDGSAVWVQATQTATPTVSVWRDKKDGTAPTVLASWQPGYRLGLLPVMCADTSDSLYVVTTPVTGGPALTFRKLTKSGGAWSLGGPATSGDSAPYLARSISWHSSGMILAEFSLGANRFLGRFDAAAIAAGAAGGGGLQSDSRSAESGWTRSKAGFTSADTLGANSGIVVYTDAPTALKVGRYTVSASAVTVSATTAVTVARATCLSLVRVGAAKWVLTTIDANLKLVAYVITASGTAAPTVSAAVLSAVTVTGDPFLGFGDASWDGSRVNQVMPSDYGVAASTSDYVRARFDPTALTWSAAAAYPPVAGQAKELSSLIAVSPLVLAPEVTRSDATTDWLLTSLGAPASGGSASYTVHETDVPRVFATGQVRNGDGSAYTGGAVVAMVRSDGTVTSSTTSSTADGTYSLPVPASGTYELVAFSADATLTAATGIKATV